jgi:hypothetical protein
MLAFVHAAWGVGIFKGLQFCHPTLCGVRHGLNVVYAVAVEINAWKAQVIVTPDQFSIRNVERSKLL